MDGNQTTRTIIFAEMNKITVALGDDMFMKTAARNLIRKCNVRCMECFAPCIFLFEVCLSKKQHFMQHELSDLGSYFSALLESTLFCGVYRYASTFLWMSRSVVVNN